MLKLTFATCYRIQNYYIYNVQAFFPDNISLSNSSGELYVVVEMCELGNLKEFLQANQNNFINELKLLPPETANGETKDGYLRPTSNKQRSQYAVSFRIKLLIFEKKRILKVHQI